MAPKTGPLNQYRYQLALIDISTSNTISNAIDLGSGKVFGIITPSAWTAANIQFKASLTFDGSYLDVYDDDGTIVAVSAAADRAIAVSTDALNLSPWRYIKLVTDAGQAADREIYVVTKG